MNSGFEQALSDLESTARLLLDSGDDLDAMIAALAHREQAVAAVARFTSGSAAEMAAVSRAMRAAFEQGEQARRAIRDIRRSVSYESARAESLRGMLGDAADATRPSDVDCAG